jgi:hypothetical protein
LLTGEVQPDLQPAETPETRFVEGSGLAFNTIPPSDAGFFELLNELVQEKPAGSNEHRATGSNPVGGASRSRRRRPPTGGYPDGINRGRVLGARTSR